MNVTRVFAALTPVMLLSSVIFAQGSGPALTLEEAIRTAFEKNPGIKVEAYAPGIARARWLEAIGQFDPALTFGRSYAEDGKPASADPLVRSLDETDSYSLAIQGMVPWGLSYSLSGNADNHRGTSNHFTDSYSTFGGITVTQPLLRGFGFGANLAGIRIAKADRSISEWDYRQTVIDTITNVVTAYSNLVLAHDQLRIARSSHDLAATLLGENEKRLRIGSMAQSDVTAARTQAAMREEPILIAERAVRNAENVLRELMGETSFSPSQPPLAIETPVPPEVTVDPAADLQKAFLNRPDYQAARLGIVKNRASDAAARNGLLPQVDFIGGYGYNGLDRHFAASRHMVAEGENRSYSAGVVVTIPFTFAQERGRARAARLQLEQAEADLKRIEADIAVSVANAAGQIETARQRMSADQAALDLAHQALEDEVKKLRAGTPGTSTLSVIQAQQILISIENSMAGAQAAQRLAVANYDHELGTTLQRYHVVLDGP
ncbi:MAG TPA: TolC family protein [Opitutaceae bacterium]|nr:TolC family protein [Opitutaceae bacterium]